MLKLVAAAAALFLVAVYLLQDRLVFHPQPLSAVQRAGLAKRYPGVREVFLIATDGARLHAWHVGGPGLSALAIYFGGNAEEVSWMLERLVRAPGVAWLLVDYRGYGGSEGVPSESLLVSDALAWHAHAASLDKRIFLFGRSLGSGVAVQLAAQRPVAGVVLVTPFDSLVEVGKRHYPFLPVGLLLRHRFDSLSRAPSITAPLLCLVATRDEIIPAEHARRLYDAWAGPKRWVALEEAGHNTTDSHPLFWQSVTDFLVKSPS